MPKEKKLPPEKISSAILCAKNDLLSEDGRVQPPSHEIWVKIAKELENKYAPKTLYIFVKTNKYELLKKLGLMKEDELNNELNDVIKDNSQFKQEEILKELEESSSDGDSSHSSVNSSDKTNSELKFTITLNPSEWNEMRPEDVLYKCSDKKRHFRKYKIFSPKKWTPIIAEHFYMHTKLNCCLSFKRAKIYENGKHYAVSKANCYECESELSVIIENEPKENSKVLIFCSYTGNYTKCQTAMKRRQIGRVKEASLEALKGTNICASEFRKAQARKLMNFGDREPSNLPTSNALRVLKSKALAEDRGDKDPISSIHLMKYASKARNAIKCIGLDPFYVFYWLPEQIYVFREYSKLNASKISIDATGGVVKKIRRPEGNKSSVIFLYEITVQDPKTEQQYSVGNMLSEKNDTNTISFWLAEWKKDVGESPKEIVTDHSMALLSASAKAFTSIFDINAYIGICFEAIFSNSSVLPNCFLRTDVAHTMKLICSWNIFKNVTKRTKLFYVCALAQIMMSTCIKDIQELFENIFIVALSESEGTDMNTGEITHCELAKSKVKHRIAVNAGSESEKLVLDNVEDVSEIPEDYNEPTGFSSWVQRIANDSRKVIENDEGDHDNSQYLPAIVDLCINLAKKLPLWTAIMVPLFKYGTITASSAPVESSFNNLKQRIFSEKKLPLRADDFLKIHIQSLEGSMILAVSKQLHNQNEEQHIHEKDLVKNSSVVISKNLPKVSDYEKNIPNKADLRQIDDTENWRGEVLQPNSRKGKSYLSAHPEILTADMSSSKKSLPIGILKNGSMYTKLKALSFNNKKIILTNTCAFDSMCQIFASAISDSQMYKRIFEVEQDSLFHNFILEISKNISSKSYKVRGELLLTISKVTDLPNNVSQIACENTAKNIIDHFLKEFPSVIENHVCINPDHSKSVKRTVISLCLNPQDIRDLNKYVDEYLLETETDCNFNHNSSICTEKKLQSAVLQKSHIIIEVVNSAVSQSMEISTRFNFLVRLRFIPQKLVIQQTIYRLRGIICFTPPDTLHGMMDIGHYRAVCLRPNEQWELYDDLKDSKIDVSDQRPYNCEILIYTI